MSIRDRSAPLRARARNRGAADGAPTRAETPVGEVVGGPGRLSRESFRELWRFREVQLAFAARQLKVRYKQAILGAGWVVLQPLIAAAIFALFLGRYANVASDGAPYFPLALAGMAVWGYYTTAVNTGAERLGVLVVATLAYGLTPAASWLALPVPVLIIVMFAGACALGLSSLNIYYRDVRYVLPFALQLGVFASPVAYPLSLIPSAWREPYAILNPIAAAIDALRRIVLHGRWPDPSITLGALGWSLLLLVLGALLFKRLERGFADRV